MGLVFKTDVGNALKVRGVGAENKGRKKNIKWGGCDPQQIDGMYLFQFRNSKEF